MFSVAVEMKAFDIRSLPSPNIGFKGGAIGGLQPSCNFLQPTQILRGTLTLQALLQDEPPLPTKLPPLSAPIQKFWCRH